MYCSHPFIHHGEAFRTTAPSLRATALAAQDTILRQLRGPRLGGSWRVQGYGISSRCLGYLPVGHSRRCFRMKSPHPHPHLNIPVTVLLTTTTHPLSRPSHRCNSHCQHSRLNQLDNANSCKLDPRKINFTPGPAHTMHRMAC